MSYLTFKNQWIGRRVDYDGIYGHQCVDLIKQYLAQNYGMKPGAWGNAIDYWYSTNPAVLKKFDRLSTSKARRGDIVIFKGVNGNPYGHIGICDSDVGLSIYVQTLEQNGATGNGSGVGGDAIRVRGIIRTRVVGVLRPKAAKPSLVMPKIGSKVLFSTDPRTCFNPGTTKVSGVLRNDGKSYHVVRGYDPVYPNRILIYTPSGGSRNATDYKAVALYYTNGTKIPGWKLI